MYFDLIVIAQRFAVFTAGLDDSEMKLPVQEFTVREAGFSQEIFTPQLEKVIIITVVDSLTQIDFKKRDTQTRYVVGSNSACRLRLGAKDYLFL
jgi:hypothetical protein